MMAEGDHFMGDRVPGKVKDSLPLIPDHVVEALDKGVDVPVEAFSSGEARERLEDRMAHRSDPVHAENLVPVARNDPRIQPRTDGHTLPKVPSMRRVIPAPFRRPSAVMRQDHGRSWQLVRADQVEIGDIVADFGKVTGKAIRVDHKLASELFADSAGLAPDTEIAVGSVVILTSLIGAHRIFSPAASVRAFAKDGTGQVIRV